MADLTCPLCGADVDLNDNFGDCPLCEAELELVTDESGEDRMVLRR